MIPLKLKIKGLYSYQDEQVIDFNRLTDAGLFGIFGKVGSGKSAILEAMAYGIYGDTERLLSRGDSRYYNMLNLKSKEATIDFTFTAGRENKTYNTYVKFQRNSRKFDEVKIKDHIYSIIHESKYIPVEKSQVLDEIGINYSNFKKTVIIPQGQFKEFLELGTADRTTMLKDLFALQKYDLGFKLGSIQKKNTEKLDILRGEMIGLSELTEELIRETEKTSLIQKGITEELLRDHKIKANELIAYDQLKSDFEKLAFSLSILEAKKLEEEKFRNMERELNEFEKTSNIFSRLLNDQLNLKKEILDRSKAIEDLQKLLVKAAEELEKTKVIHLKCTEDVKLNDELNKRCDQLATLVEVVELETRIQAMEALLKAINDRIQTEIVEKQALLLRTISTLEKENEILGVQSLSDTLIMEMNRWYVNMDNQDEVLSTLNKEQEQVHKSIELNKARIEEAINLRSYDELKNLRDNFHEDDFQETINKINENLKNELNNLNKSKSDLELKNKIKEFAEHLVDGKPCMLCGSHEHPSPLSIEREDDKILEVSKQIEIIINSEAEVKKFSHEILKCLIQIAGLKKNDEELIKKIEESTFKKLNLENEKPENIYNLGNRKDYEAEVKVINQNKIKIKSNTEDLKKTRHLLEELDKKLKSENELLELTKSEFQKASGSLATLLKDIKDLNREELRSFSVDAINIQIQEIKETIAGNNKKLEEIKIKLDKINAWIAGKNGSLSVEIKVLEDDKTKLELNETQLTRELIDHNLSEEAVKNILSRNMNSEVVRKEITEYMKALDMLKGEVKALSDIIKDKTYSKESHEELKTKVDELKTKSEEANTLYITLNNKLENQNQDFEKKKKFQSDFDKLNIRAEDIKTMSSLFKASGFVEFVSRKRLQNVVNLANHRFYKMSRQKFKMELSEEGDFIVRDFMNEGRTRLLKSLSGGQTFQAALSLALALSESIQRNAGVDQHFFFLDEGFGTLDKESLEIVFDTLKSLRKENRVVGLITHVEELQNDLDLYLTVTNEADKGSIIKRSWNV